jgi:hypothetical protein
MVESMLTALKKQANKTFTENGAVTNQTTFSDRLDFFASCGALRHATEEEIITRFVRAFAENPLHALKILFFARDVRGGLGERRLFRIAIAHLAKVSPEILNKNLWAVAKFGRFDDLLGLLDTPLKHGVITLIKNQLGMDMKALNSDEGISLLGKWLPSINAHNAKTVSYGKIVAKEIGLSEAEYRRTLSRLRAKIAIIENNLREKDYTFEYEKQPSKALYKYGKAFSRNDGERYNEFLAKVSEGKASLNTSTLYPYDIVRPCFEHGNRLNACDRARLETTWLSMQKDFSSNENAIVVVDGSGSMYNGADPMPITVAISLAIYFAEKNTGKFGNHFITFSEKPQLVEIKGKDIYEKVTYCASFNEIANTNLERVFSLLLETAVINKLPQSELPSKIYIISDMEFDACVANPDFSNSDNAKKMFKKHAYTLPSVVFWNVQSRNSQYPVTQNDKGVVLVSGASPSLFKMINDGNLSPIEFMMSVLNQERYAEIVL